MNMTAGLAAACHSLHLHSDAQHYFKRVIDSTAIPIDIPRLFLASSYFYSGSFEECRELIISLYCQCIYDVGERDSFKARFSMCLREAVAMLVSSLSQHYYDQGKKFDEKGDDLTTTGMVSGE